MYLDKISYEFTRSDLELIHSFLIARGWIKLGGRFNSYLKNGLECSDMLMALDSQMRDDIKHAIAPSIKGED